MMVKIQSFFKHYSPRNYLWPIVSGILIGTSYIPFPPWALLFCYVPLWIFTLQKAKTWKEAFAAGWWTQFTLSLIGFYWIAYVTKQFGGFPWPFAVFVLFIFAALVHLYIPLASALVFTLQKKYSLKLSTSLVTLALVLSLLERVWPSIFPWHLGYTLLWAKIPAYNWADVIGFEGLSTVILLFNAWIAWMWERRNEIRKITAHAVAAVLLLVTLNVAGHLHGTVWEEMDRRWTVSIVQANIGDSEKVAAEQGLGHFQESIVRRFLNLTQQAVLETPTTGLIVWPETAVPDYLDAFNAHTKIPRLIATSLQPLGKPLLTGSYAKDAPGSKAKRLTYNALFLVDPNAQALGTYHKTFLLAFGEYLPLSERFPYLLTLLPFIANFGRGSGPEVLTYPHTEGDIKIGGQICYEGLYPDFTRGLAEKKADLLANVTNDSWFGKTSEPYQHLYMTLARAIEVRRPLIRSTNTGISTVILANGHVLQQSPLHQEWQGSYDVQWKNQAPLTAFVKWGHFDWILILLALAALLFKGVIDARTHRP